MISAFIVLLALGNHQVNSSSPVSQLPNNGAEKQAKWETNLRATLADHKRPIVIELLLTDTIPELKSPRDTTSKERAKLLSWVLQRTRKEFGETTCLVRAQPPESEFGTTTSGSLTDMLMSLDPSTIKALGEGMSFWDLDESAQNKLGKLAGLNQGLMNAIMNGESLEIKVGLAPVARIDTSEYTYFTPIGGSETIGHGNSVSSKKRPLKPTDAEPEFLRTGGIEFQPGKVMTVFELLTEFQSKWKETFYADGKLLDELIFVQGHFSKEECAEVLKALLSAIRPEPQKWTRKNRWEALKDRFASKIAENGSKLEGTELPFENFVDSGKVPYDSLASKFPNLKNDLANGLYKSGGSVNVSMGIRVSFRGNGMSPSLHGYAILDGKKQPMMEQNRVNFLITP